MKQKSVIFDFFLHLILYTTLYIVKIKKTNQIDNIALALKHVTKFVFNIN